MFNRFEGWFVLVSCIFILSAIVEAKASDQNGEAKDEQTEPKACCGGTRPRWIYERLVGGEVQQTGTVLIYPGRTVYEVFPLVDGTWLKIASMSPPLDKGELPPDLAKGKRYFDGHIAGIGTVYAEEYLPGEVWRFTYSGYSITDDTGFIAGEVINAKIESSLVGRWDENWELQIGSSGWAAVNCSGSDDFLLGGTGTQWEELSPEQQLMGWTPIGLPKGVGHFFGRSHAAGEIWTVTINGVSYTATVGQADPTAIPLDQSVPPS